MNNDTMQVIVVAIGLVLIFGSIGSCEYNLKKQQELTMREFIKSDRSVLDMRCAKYGECGWIISPE